MKTIIAGCRHITQYARLQQAIQELPWTITEVVSGAAKGADNLGEQYAEARNLPLHLFPADWEAFGRAAGPKRNRTMAENAEALLALWDGKSKGTANMIKEARKLGLRIHICLVG